MWCAGRNEVGELGNGKAPMGAAATDEAPTEVAGIQGARQVVAGEHHACALVGTFAWCWGSNKLGQLGARIEGDNGSAMEMTATPIRVKNLERARYLAAGDTHTCAIREDDSVYCWGGRTGEVASAGARRVQGVAHAAQLALGAGDSCALRKEDGFVACWSIDGAPVITNPGFIGAEIARTRSSTCVRRRSVPADIPPFKVNCWGGRFGAQPTEVKQLVDTTFLRGGADLVCGIHSNGTVRCSAPNLDYHVTVGDGGVPATARLIAVRDTFTMSVHWHDNTDVIDADDALPGKSVFDALGATAPQSTDPIHVRTTKLDPFALPPSSAAPSPPLFASCDERKYGGTGVCEEYASRTGDTNAERRCRSSGGAWSSSPCPRENARGSCVPGASREDHGATVLFYSPKLTEKTFGAGELCAKDYQGTYSAPPASSPH